MGGGGRGHPQREHGGAHATCGSSGGREVVGEGGGMPIAEGEAHIDVREAHQEPGVVNPFGRVG